MKFQKGHLKVEGSGRAKGTVNKTTATIKEMILKALDESGGVAYLARQAEENPTAFMSLLAKVLPLQLTGEDGGPLVTEIRLVAVAADSQMSNR